MKKLGLKARLLGHYLRFRSAYLDGQKWVLFSANKKLLTIELWGKCCLFLRQLIVLSFVHLSDQTKLLVPVHPKFSD